MKNSKLALGFIAASMIITSWDAQSTEKSSAQNIPIEVPFLAEIGDICPVIDASYEEQASMYMGIINNLIKEKFSSGLPKNISEPIRKILKDSLTELNNSIMDKKHPARGNLGEYMKNLFNKMKLIVDGYDVGFGYNPVVIYQNIILELKRLIPELNDSKRSGEQGGNSTVYLTNNSAIKISKNVQKYGPNSEGNKALKAAGEISQLKNPIFTFYPPTKIYQLISLDQQRVCDIQIAPIAQGQKINDYVYKFADGRSIDNSVFEKLGKALAQFQTNNLMENREYGPQHGDFQVGNIFYNESNGIFSLIDLSDFNRNGRLILDPIYFVYFLPHMWGPGGPKNQEFFRDKYRTELDFQNRIDKIVFSFFNGYVTNLPLDVKEKMYNYLTKTENPGFSAFGHKAQENKRYGQDLQNPESMEILEPLIKKAFMTAYEVKFESPVKPQTAQSNVGRDINRPNVPKDWGAFGS